MAEPFDIVAAAGTLEDAGIETQKARAVAPSSSAPPPSRASP